MSLIHISFSSFNNTINNRMQYVYIDSKYIFRFFIILLFSPLFPWPLAKYLFIAISAIYLTIRTLITLTWSATFSTTRITLHYNTSLYLFLFSSKILHSLFLKTIFFSKTPIKKYDKQCVNQRILLVYRRHYIPCTKYIA